VHFPELDLGFVPSSRSGAPVKLRLPRPQVPVVVPALSVLRLVCPGLVLDPLIPRLRVFLVFVVHTWWVFSYAYKIFDEMCVRQ
jgi:hypothetical protein